jgi:hypothetical protein
MKSSFLSLGLVVAHCISLIHLVEAFQAYQIPFAGRRNLALAAVVALEPEPPGGIVLQPIGTTVAANSRVKQLDDVLPQSSSNGQPTFAFWMTTTADGKLIQEIRQTILKDASKKANFPGFRKVCIVRKEAPFVVVVFFLPFKLLLIHL